jgi:hypothetical protein
MVDDVEARLVLVGKDSANRELVLDGVRMSWFTSGSTAAVPSSQAKL